MAHVAKYTRAAVGHLSGHFERAKDSNGDFIKFSNGNIDTEKSGKNFNLAPKRDISQGEFIRQRCDEVKCLKRKDVNVLCSWVVTAPKSVEGTEDERKFFDETYKFLSEKYGEKNVVSAFVHKDEVTPHIHFAFVPVVTDSKTGDLKVSAKECLTKNHLQKFHDELDAHMAHAFGRDLGVINGATKEGNVAIQTLRRGTAAEELRIIERETAQKRAELAELDKKLLDASDVQKLAEKGKKTFLGGLKDVSFSEFQALTATAGRVDEALKNEREAKNALAGELEKIAEKEKALAEERERVRVEAEKTPSQLLKSSNAQILERNKVLNAKNLKLEGVTSKMKSALSGILKDVKDSLSPEKLERVEGAINAANSLLERSRDGLGR